MAKRVDSKILKNQLQVLFERHRETLKKISRLQYEASALEQAMTALKEAHDQVVKLNGEDLKQEDPKREVRVRKAPEPGKVYQKTCVRCSTEFMAKHTATRICPRCREKGLGVA